MRTRLVLLAVAAAGLAGVATPANACAGPVCEAICELTVPVTRNCIVK